MSPLALYIHWPFCKSKCPYCDFNSHVRDAVDQTRWRNALLKELEWTAERTQGRTITSIFFGGGTPSLMPVETVAAIIESVNKRWDVDKSAEITLEANPTSVESANFSQLAGSGVNRVSLGVQALNEADLKFLGRTHSPNEALHAVELAAKYFARYSFDLIYARPGQTVQDWENELCQALPYTNDHMSLYQLTIEENTAFHHAYHKDKAFTLPDEDNAVALYEVTQAIMEQAGMPAYEISNHARPGQESRHNLAYWLGQEYAGIGPGAHGRLRLPAANGQLSGTRSGDLTSHQPAVGANKWFATESIKSPERWLEAVEREGHGVVVTPMNVRERQEEWLMMRLRLPRPIPYSEAPFADVRAALVPYASEGLIALEESECYVTRKGHLLLGSLVASLSEKLDGDFTSNSI